MKEARKKPRGEIDLLEHKYLPEFVYGGIDGAVTTFAVVSGAIGASLNPVIVLILGFANLIGDGFSMSISNYLSTKSERELHPKHRFSFGKPPVKTALATFLSFFIIGFIPLFSFVLAAIFKNNYLISSQFALSFVLTGVALCVVGFFKGRIVGKHPLKSSIETLIIGGVAAALAFMAGYLVKSFLA
ncbi:MAG: VIT1/CCC1 transporter family protein [Nanoarchaeota archaeon]